MDSWGKTPSWEGEWQFAQSGCAARFLSSRGGTGGAIRKFVGGSVGVGELGGLVGEWLVLLGFG